MQVIKNCVPFSLSVTSQEKKTHLTFFFLICNVSCVSFPKQILNTWVVYIFSVCTHASVNHLSLLDEGTCNSSCLYSQHSGDIGSQIIIVQAQSGSYNEFQGSQCYT